MTNENILVEERSRDTGNFLVGRLLPFRKKRQAGPFTFIDHMGPAQLGAREYMDVDQHPHIGRSTLTYLLEGQIEHRDSTGVSQVIKPGGVGFMTAGSGVTHTERTPKALRDGNPFTAHGYQMLISKTESTCSLELGEQTRVLLFGGRSFPEPRYLLWNFVSASKERLQKAKTDWENWDFPKVPEDDTYIPIPSKK